MACQRCGRNKSKHTNLCKDPSEYSRGEASSSDVSTTPCKPVASLSESELPCNEPGAKVPQKFKELTAEFIWRNDGIALSEFIKKFAEQTGEKFDYAKWGFWQLSACLSSLDKILSLEHKQLFAKERVKRQMLKNLSLRSKEKDDPDVELSCDISDSDTVVSYDSFRSNFERWNTIDPWAAEMLEVVEAQLRFPASNLLCAACSYIVSLDRPTLLKCGCLVCRLCALQLVDRRRSPACRSSSREPLRHRYERSVLEVLVPISPHSSLSSAREFYHYLASVPICCRAKGSRRVFSRERQRGSRGFQQGDTVVGDIDDEYTGCSWKSGVLGRWKAHCAVCPKMARSRQYGHGSLEVMEQQVAESPALSLDPVVAEFHKKIFKELRRWIKASKRRRRHRTLDDSSTRDDVLLQDRLPGSRRRIQYVTNAEYLLGN